MLWAVSTKILKVWGVWKTQNAGTTWISFVFAIGVMCKHFHATDREDTTVELTMLLMISSAAVLKIVAHTHMGRVFLSGGLSSASTNWDLLNSGKSIASLHLYAHNLCYPRAGLDSFAPTLFFFNYLSVQVLRKSKCLLLFLLTHA